MPNSLPLTAPLVRTETAALRRLARALVHDPALADDIVQATWLAAVRSPPDTTRALRPWLTQVLRRNVVSFRRAAKRSESRERAVAGVSSTEDPAPERVEATRLLLGEIERLSPRDRELVRLVFWEGLTAVECAVQLRLPPSTVRSRLQRTLVRLRDRLDARGGGRKAWMAALVPFVGPMPVRGSTLFAGGMISAMAIAVVVVAPHGCGGPLQTSADEPSAASPAGVREDATTPRSVPRAPRRSEPTQPTQPTRTREDSPAVAPAGDRGALKLAFFEALRDQTDALAECRDERGPGSARLASKVAYALDHAPIVESVELSRVAELTDDELECMRQTALALEIASVGLPPGGEGASVHVYDVSFADDGRVDIQGFRRGPPTHLRSRRKDGGDLDEAVAACAPGGATEVRITFDPTTGAATQIDADHPRVGACIDAALGQTLLGSRPFEPERPEDAIIVCTFDDDGHSCARLGPDGSYL